MTAYLEAGGAQEYYLASAADRIAMYRVKVTGKNGIHVAGRDEGPRPPQEEQERH